MTQSKNMHENTALIEKVLLIAEAANEKKAKDIKAFDISGLTLIADAFILCTASSEPQLKAVANAAREKAREAGHTVLRVEGDHHCGWVIVDFGDVLLHVFRQQAREFYDLDRMWADAPELVLLDNAD
ncbi:MAG: ribosome silencing factor [Candidatus Hydrogenedentes bacterium]|nr:ribosome silencing factor [Candidatus Hydrogenedentota bacterium]